MRIVDIQESVWVNANPESAWRCLSDLERWPQWNPSVRGARWVGRGGWSAGERFRLRAEWRSRGLLSGAMLLAGGPFPAGGRIIEVEPERRIRWAETFRTIRVEFALELEPEGQGTRGRGTRIRFDSRFEGLLLRIVSGDSFTRWQTRYQREFLAQLRGACERVSGESR